MTDVKLQWTSEYLTMRDGVRLAVSTVVSEDILSRQIKIPVVVVTTRYWRTMAFKEKSPKSQVYYSLAATLCPQGYGLVVADARGSGASFGCRETEISHDEVADIGEVINWASQQLWCDGRVVTTGVSYSANTALFSLVSAPNALEASFCRAPDFDVYRHLMAPGGIVNCWFIEAWGQATAAQDRNDVKALFAGAYMLPPKEGADNVLGVSPVDTDNEFEYGAEGSLLAAALADHQNNYQLNSSIDSLAFIENDFFAAHRPYFDPEYQQAIERAQVRLTIRCGWHDAGTALGALSMYVSFGCPLRIKLGPWNHEGSYHVDPMDDSDGVHVGPFNIEQARAASLNSLDAIFKPDQHNQEGAIGNAPFRAIEYYTLGEARWKTTEQWPLPQTQMQRWYLSPDHQLSTNKPASTTGSDKYQVDPTAATGLYNRWYAQSSNQAILFPDRREADNKLLVYDTPPLEQATEMTGHPVVSLFVRSSATDGQFFVYLETVDPDGRVRLLTEGQLRGIHRKVSDEKPPYIMFGPYHSLKQKDAQLMVVGEVTEITFDLFPISVLLPKGQRLRVAIAGADADVFAPIEGCETPELTVERNSVFASYIDLPII